MSKILIITDTSCDIPMEFIKYDNVEIIPMIFNIDGKPLCENVDFTSDNFYEILPKRECISSIQIPAAIYIDRFAHAQAHGYTDVLVITSNSKISPMYTSANEGKEMFKKNNPDSNLNINIVDSETYTMGTGLIVLKAIKLVNEDKDIDEILQAIDKMINSVEIVVNSFCVKNIHTDHLMDWLKKLAAEFTHPYPTFEIINNNVKELPIIKGDHTAFDQYYAYCVESLTDKKPEYAIGYAVREQEAKAIAMLLQEELGYPPISIYKIGAFSSYCSGRASITLSFIGDTKEHKVDED